jgi:hypothetical protein
VLEQVPGDQGARGADRAEREVQDARRPVERDHADPGERVDPAEREPERDERL